MYVSVVKWTFSNGANCSLFLCQNHIDVFASKLPIELIFGFETSRLDIMRIANLNQGNTNWFYKLDPIYWFAFPHEHVSNNFSEMILLALLIGHHKSVKSRIKFDTMLQYCKVWLISLALKINSIIAANNGAANGFLLIVVDTKNKWKCIYNNE